MGKIKRAATLVFIASLSGANAQSTGLNYPVTDGLGRKLPTYEEVGDVREGKVVALFYWTWHSGLSSRSKALDLSKIMENHPEIANDYENPLWASYTNQEVFFWTEPLFDFYDGKDKWVIRKQLEMLGAAGVDVLFFDATNGSFLWKEGYEAVGEAMAEARADGIEVPQFAFMLNFGPLKSTAEMLVMLYDELYEPGKYRDSWFMWQGKPAVMAYPEAMDLKDLPPEIAEKAEKIKSFFTFRPAQPTYEGGPTRKDQWGWLENVPQHGYVEKSLGKYELMTVGVAQNWSEQTQGLSAMNGVKIHGRSYTKAEGFSRRTDDSYLYGYNFQEQWDRALQVDPDIVFITGWNEWVMGRFEKWQDVENAFPDQFNKEHSRDIEPMKGGYSDNYYYQMIANIRKFKGMERPEATSLKKTISMDGKFAEWDDVKPHFKASKGNTRPRDGYGYIDKDSPAGEPLRYENNSGRNDIVAAKVACDEIRVYFYVEAAEALTDPSDGKWMQLLIDIDRNKQTGWEGYDFVLGTYAKGGQAILTNPLGEEVAKVDFKKDGSKMEIAIPRSQLGLPPGQLLDLEFKWIDNLDPQGDIMEFYLNGDAAPGGRFNYHYPELLATP